MIRSIIQMHKISFRLIEICNKAARFTICGTINAIKVSTTKLMNQFFNLDEILIFQKNQIVILKKFIVE